MRILFADVLASASAQADYPLAKSLTDGVILPTEGARGSRWQGAFRTAFKDLREALLAFLKSL
jgi:hypothetical protein